jgi:uncharacterized damage-inducible protein DinB
MNKEIIREELQQTFAALTKLIATFDDRSFNEIPFEGSWTAGQVAQHINLASSGFSNVLNGEVENTERAIDSHIASLKDIFLNFGIKMKSPDFILPKQQDYDRNMFLTTFNQTSKDISEAIMELDLSKTCLGFQFPDLGHLTRLEAIYFVIFHTQRHNRQLTEIKRFLKLS